MVARPLLSSIVRDEALTRNLGDEEARMLVEWLVDHVEKLGGTLVSDRLLQTEVKNLCRRARVMARFVELWCHRRTPGAAIQLAAVERWTFPLPDAPIDACDLMEELLEWERDREEE